MEYSAIQNFQIPVADFDRALQFYNRIMDYQLRVMEYGGARLGLFKFRPETGGIGGSIIQSKGMEPGARGTMVYLQAGNDLQPFLERIAESGGQILVAKTALGPEMGYFAIFMDTEGNKVGLYSRQ